jgi:hypothetical protein
LAREDQFARHTGAPRGFVRSARIRVSSESDRTSDGEHRERIDGVSRPAHPDRLP